MKQCEEIFFSSTFAGETLSLAAAVATLDELKRRDGLSHVWRQGEKLLKGLDVEIRALCLSAEIIGFGPRQFMNFFDEEKKPSLLLKALYFQECAKRGILFGNAQFVSYSHGDAEIEKTIAVAVEALKIVSQAVCSGRPEEWYEGRMPQEIFRKV